MPIEAVKIPQNVQIEDKVVGPLSLRQIIIIACGGGFSYMIYASVQRSIGHVSIPLTIAIWTPALICAAFALVNINDLSLMRICFLMLERMQKPTRRIWGPRPGISINLHFSSVKVEDDPVKKKVIERQRSAEQQIAELSSIADRPQMPGAADMIADDPLPAAFAQPATIAEPAPLPKPPVNPAQIRVDTPPPAAQPGTDLAVFRDIFPPNTPWQA